MALNLGLCEEDNFVSLILGNELEIGGRYPWKWPWIGGFGGSGLSCVFGIRVEQFPWFKPTRACQLGQVVDFQCDFGAPHPINGGPANARGSRSCLIRGELLTWTNESVQVICKDFHSAFTHIWEYAGILSPSVG